MAILDGLILAGVLGTLNYVFNTDRNVTILTQKIAAEEALEARDPVVRERQHNRELTAVKEHIVSVDARVLRLERARGANDE